MADFQEVKDQILGLMESLKQLEASTDPDKAHQAVMARIEKLEKDMYARFNAIMEKLNTLDPFYYPITTTWPAKDTNPHQPWQPTYEPPYKIICEASLTNGMTVGPNSAEIQEMAAPLRIYRRTRGCRR